MKAKSLLIPVAAFAVTVTGAHAFSTSVLEEAGLSNDQISAFEEAHELRKEGDRDAARDVLVEAGVDAETMEAVREAMREHRSERREAVHDAVANNDYDAFKEAVADSPIAEIVDSEADFELFVEAYELREAGDKEAAKEIMEELGFEGKPHGKHGGGHGKGQGERRGGDVQ